MIELEKYKGLSTRYTCPKCGRGRCFTKYIDTETNQYIDNSVGICNHKNSCGYHLPPSIFFEMNPEKRKEGYVNDFFDKDRIKEMIPIQSIPRNLIMQYIGGDSNLLTFLKSKFPKDIIKQVRLDYLIGNYDKDRVVFWQIDRIGNVRAGKVMLYSEITGKRFRSEPEAFNENGTRQSWIPPVQWIHNYLKKDNLLPKDWKMTQCLFGEHLYAKYPYKKIVVVESEKTAIIMACKCPEYNWLATGGLGNLNSQKIFPIKDADIIVYPDYGQYEYWKQKAEMINHELGSNVIVSKTFEDLARLHDLDMGSDIADYFLENIEIVESKKKDIETKKEFAETKS